MTRRNKRLQWLREGIRNVLRFIFIFNLFTVLLIGLLVLSFFLPEQVSVSDTMVWTWYWMLVTVATAREAIRFSGDHHPKDYVFRMLVQGEVYTVLFVLALVSMFAFESFSKADLTVDQVEVLMLTRKITLMVVGLYAGTLVSKLGNKRIKFYFGRFTSVLGVWTGLSMDPNDSSEDPGSQGDEVPEEGVDPSHDRDSSS